MDMVRQRPEHEAIYLRVREMILLGDMAPGQPVTIHGLAEGLSAGVTPVREAIRSQRTLISSDPSAQPIMDTIAIAHALLGRTGQDLQY